MCSLVQVKLASNGKQKIGFFYITIIGYKSYLLIAAIKYSVSLWSKQVIQECFT